MVIEKGGLGESPPEKIFEILMQNCVQSSQKNYNPPSFGGKKITTPPP